MSIRILIADDHPIIRSGIKNELAHHADLKVVGEATNGLEAIQMASEMKPDVVMLDVNMPGPKAPVVLHSLKEEAPSCRVLVITAYGDTGTVRGMLRAGADGYFVKDDDAAMIPAAIRALAEGKSWFSASVSQDLIASTRRNNRIGKELTDREEEIVRLIATGSTNKEIAAHLQTTERTVEFHVGHILQKLGVRSRLEVVVWAKEHGLA